MLTLIVLYTIFFVCAVAAIVGVGLEALMKTKWWSWPIEKRRRILFVCLAAAIINIAITFLMANRPEMALMRGQFTFGAVVWVIFMGIILMRLEAQKKKPE